MQCARVSGEMPLWPRPHLAVIVISRVEPPDSFLPSESMESPPPPSLATGWVLDHALQTGPAFLRRRPGNTATPSSPTN